VAVEVSGRLLGRGLVVVAAALAAASSVAAGIGKPVSADDKIAALCTDLNTSIFSSRFDRAIELTFPGLVTLVGRDRILASLKAAAEGTPEFRTLAIACETPTQHSTAGGLAFALVPTLAQARTPDGMVYLPQLSPQRKSPREEGFLTSGQRDGSRRRGAGTG
jgi:hypothetical protein